MIGAGRNGRDPASTTIVADKFTTLDFMMFTGTSSCRVRWSFTPAAGRSYLVSGGVVTGVSGAHCAARVLDATDPDDIVIAGTAVRRDLSGSACLPSAQAYALKSARAGTTRAVGDAAVLTPGAGDADLQGLIAR